MQEAGQAGCRPSERGSIAGATPSLLKTGHINPAEGKPGGLNKAAHTPEKGMPEPEPLEGSRRSCLILQSSATLHSSQKLLTEDL